MKWRPIASTGTGTDVACLSNTRFSLRSSTTGSRRANTTGATQPGTLRASPGTARASTPLRCATMADVTRSSSVRYVGAAAVATIVLATGRRPARPYRASEIAGNTGSSGTADAAAAASVGALETEAEASGPAPTAATEVTEGITAEVEVDALPAPPCAGADTGAANVAASDGVADEDAGAEAAEAAEAAAADSSSVDTSSSLTWNSGASQRFFSSGVSYRVHKSSTLQIRFPVDIVQSHMSSAANEGKATVKAPCGAELFGRLSGRVPS